jgi:hypothetical protein
LSTSLSFGTVLSQATSLNVVPRIVTGVSWPGLSADISGSGLSLRPPSHFDISKENQAPGICHWCILFPKYSFATPSPNKRVLNLRHVTIDLFEFIDNRALSGISNKQIN